MDDLVYSASRYSFFFLLLLDWNFSTSNRFMDFVIYPGTFFLLVTSILLIQIYCFIESERDSRSLKKGTYKSRL